MPAQETVVRRLRDLGQGEIDQNLLDILTSNLFDQERIIDAVYGEGGLLWTTTSQPDKTDGHLLICVTGTRLLIIVNEAYNKQLIYPRYTSIQLRNISSVALKDIQELIVRLYSTRGYIQIIYGPGTNLKAFERSLQGTLSRLASGVAAPATDLADQIRKLAELRNAGAL